MRRRTWSFPFITTGIQYGLLAALAMAEGYAVIFVILQLIIPLLQGNFYPLLSLLVFFYSQLYGVLPALLVGGFTGSVVGAIFVCLPYELTVRQGATVGVVSDLVIGSAIVGSAIYWQHYLPTMLNVAHQDGTLLWVVDAPILLLYLYARGWGGAKLARARLE
jgi:hypothetical protein